MKKDILKITSVFRGGQLSRIRMFRIQVLLCILCFTAVIGLSNKLQAQSALGSTETIDVFLVIGEANAAGRGVFTPGDITTPNGIYLLNNNQLADFSMDEEFEQATIPQVRSQITDIPLSPIYHVTKHAGYNRFSWIGKSLQKKAGTGEVTDATSGLSGFNIGQSFAQVLYNITNRNIGLVVNAREDVLLDNWLETSTDYFSGTMESGKNLFYNTLDRVEHMLTNYSGRAVLKGVIWIQGEKEQKELLMYNDGQTSDLQSTYSKTQAELATFLSQRFTDYKSDFIDHLVSPMRSKLDTKYPNMGYDELPFLVIEAGQWDLSMDHTDWGLNSTHMSSSERIISGIADTFRDDSDNTISITRNFNELNTVLRTLPDRETENHIYLIESSGTNPVEFCADPPNPDDNYYCLSDPYSWQPIKDGLIYDRNSLEMLGKRAAEMYLEVSGDYLNMDALTAHYPMNIYLHNNYKEHRYRLNNGRGKIKVTGDEFLELRHWDVSGNNRHGTYFGVNKSAGTETHIQPTPPFFPMFDRVKLDFYPTDKDGNQFPIRDEDGNEVKEGGVVQYIKKNGRVNEDFNIGQEWLTWKKWSGDAVQTVNKINTKNAYLKIPSPFEDAASTKSAFSVSFWVDINPGDNCSTSTDKTSCYRTIIKTPYFSIDKFGSKLVMNYHDSYSAVKQLTYDLSAPGYWPNETKKQWYFFTLSNTNGDVTLFAKNFDDLANESSGNPLDRSLKSLADAENATFTAYDDNKKFSSTSSLMSSSFKGKLWNVRFFNEALTQGQAEELFDLDMRSVSYKINHDEKIHYSPLHHVNTNRMVYLPKGSDHDGSRFFDDYNEVEGYSVSFWVNIDEDYDNESLVPFDENTVGESFFSVTDGTNVLAGLERRNDVVGINRYYNDDYGNVFPWYLWMYEPASFNKSHGQGKYHVIMTYYPNMVRLYMYYPGEDQFIRRLHYAGAQELSKATTWNVHDDIEKFSVYDWTLDSLEVNALHYFDKQDFHDTEKESYGYDPTTTHGLSYHPSFAIVGDFGCKDGGCSVAGDNCIVDDTSTDAVDVANLTRMANPGDVSEMIDGWNPDFILTVGDNDYSDSDMACANSYEENVGTYYSKYIAPRADEITSRRNYTKKNKFFPIPGNHDYKDYTDVGEETNALHAYFDFFNLCNTDPYDMDNDESDCSGEPYGRYYTFRKGNVRFFMLNIDEKEPDGVIYDANYDPDVELNKTTPNRDGLQAWWLEQQVKASEADGDETFQVVLMHVPPYSVNYDDGNISGGYSNVWNSRSDENRDVRDKLQQWPFKAWGVDAIIAGDDHNYQKIDMNGLPLFVNGLGGHPGFASLRDQKLVQDGTDVSTTTAEYQEGYADNYGAIKGWTDATNLYLEFYSIGDASNPVSTSTISPNTGSTGTAGQAAPIQISQPEPEPEPKLTVYPNSTSDYLSISLAQDEPVEGVIQILGLNGVSYYRSEINLNQGNHQLTLDLRPILKSTYGIYVMRVTTGTQQVSKKIIYSGGGPEEEEE